MNRVHLTSSSPLSSSPSILYFGTDHFSLSIFKTLKNYNASLVHPDLKCVTKLYADQNNIKTYSIPKETSFNMSNYIPTFKNYDIGIIASFGYLIPNNIISLFKYGIINIHPSLLPKYKGSSPIQYALAEGDIYTGISIQVINERIDSGRLIYQKKGRDIEYTDNFNTLSTYLSQLSVDGLNDVLNNLPNSINRDIISDAPKSKMAMKIKHSFSIINPYEMTAREAYFRCQSDGYGIMPHICLDKKRIQIVEYSLTKPESIDSSLDIGKIVYSKEQHMLRLKFKPDLDNSGTRREFPTDFSNCMLGIKSVQLPTKKPITAIDYINQKASIKKGTQYCDKEVI